MTAIISDCGRYRYRLQREWAAGPKLTFIMLNPSTADAELDDPTIRRCIRYGQEDGYSGIVVGNLFAWRATDPKDLKKALAPIGPDNDAVLAKIIVDAPLVVCAWGGHGSFRNRGKTVLDMIKSAGKEPHCLKMTANGHPGHPLFLPARLRPSPMSKWLNTL